VWRQQPEVIITAWIRIHIRFKFKTKHQHVTTVVGLGPAWPRHNVRFRKAAADASSIKVATTTSSTGQLAWIAPPARLLCVPFFQHGTGISSRPCPFNSAMWRSKYCKRKTAKKKRQKLNKRKLLCLLGHPSAPLARQVPRVHPSPADNQNHNLNELYGPSFFFTNKELCYCDNNWCITLNNGDFNPIVSGLGLGGCHKSLLAHNNRACKALWDRLVIKGYTNTIELNWIEHTLIVNSFLWPRRDIYHVYVDTVNVLYEFPVC